MASRKDYEAAVRILCHISDPDTRLQQVQLWSDYFEVDNRNFNPKLFADAVDRVYESFNG